MINPPELKVVVVVPSMSTWHAEFAMSLIGLMAYFQNNPVGSSRTHSLQIINKRGSILPNLRLQGLKAAKELEATHLLWLDSDHSFPPDILNRLLKHEKDVVAANCAVKTIPSMPTARALDPVDPKGKPVYTDWNSHGLQRVWRIGTGIMLMSSRAFNQIPHDAFGMTYVEATDSYRGEDWGICEALQSVGCPIFIDHDVSNDCTHIGNFHYTHEYVGIIPEPEGIEEGL